VIWWIVGIAAALVIAIAIPSISQKDPEGKYVEDFVKWNRSNNPGTSDAAARTAAKELYRTSPAAANRLISSGSQGTTPRGDYASRSTDYEESWEDRQRRSAAELSDIAARQNNLAEKIVRLQADLESATSADEKRQHLDALLESYEAALENTRRTISILEGNKKYGFLSEADYQEVMAPTKNFESIATQKIAEIKKQRAGLNP